MNKLAEMKAGGRSRGFTLIELMIVVAIVAIIVALAVPAYKDYSIRAKIAECVNGAAVGKIQISEYRQSLGAWPPTAQDAGLDGAGISHYCQGFTNYSSTTGAFTIEINLPVIDPELGTVAPVMTPNQPNPTHTINWNCSRGTTPASNLKYLPATCRDS